MHAKKPNGQRIPTHELRRLAVAFDVDPRSIAKEQLQPGSVRGVAGERARAAIAELRRTPGQAA